MRLKIYRAPSITEAMRQMRGDLGADALILSTRKVADGVEVTAAMDDAEQPPIMEVQQLADPEAVRSLTYHGAPSALVHRLAEGKLPNTLAQNLAFGALPLDQGSQPIIFSGPPGAGKTLTVARLATRLVLAGTKPFIITADGKRAGAAEQLAAFTRLLGLDLVVASEPVALARALARRQLGAPVLIDMPGGSPFNEAQSQELAAMAATANASIAVVLATGLDAAEACEIATAYATAGAEYLIATRLDVSRRIGSVLAAAMSGLAMVEAGIGEGAADGLVPMTPAFLAHRLLEHVPSDWNQSIECRALKNISARAAYVRPKEPQAAPFGRTLL
jgi:flagellar biosynthesis protein FlhF